MQQILPNVGLLLIQGMCAMQPNIAAGMIVISLRLLRIKYMTFLGKVRGVLG